MRSDDWEPVKAIADLRGYTCGLGWIVLELKVKRAGAVQVVTATPRDSVHAVSIPRRASTASGPR